MDRKQVVSIKKLLAAGSLTQSEIGAKFGVSRGAVSGIATGRSYTDVKGPVAPKKLPGGQGKNVSIEQRNILLEGMVESLRAERSLLSRQLKAASKRAYIVDSIAEDLGGLIKPLAPSKKIPVKKGKNLIDETLVLVFSDTHCDQVIHPSEVDGLEHYNFSVAARRAEVLVADLLEFAKHSLCNFRFRRLVILGLGDYVSGQIHGHTAKSHFRDQFMNDLATAQLFSLMVQELSPHFEVIDWYNITGNHGRLTENIEFDKSAANANHDTLIAKIAEIHCANLKNVKFHFPEGLSTIVDILGWKFYLSHGHARKGSSVAWNRAKALSQKVVPLHKGDVNYFVTGHFHTPGDVVVSGGATLLANGAFPRCDAYSYQTLGEASEPSQLLFGVHERRGVTWRLPLKLATEGELKGPQRYNIDLLGAGK